jgi:SAM-dependent methyltransferase
VASGRCSVSLREKRADGLRRRTATTLERRGGSRMGSVPSGARSAVRAARRSARSFGSRASARSAARRWLGTGSTTVAIARRLGPTAHRVGVDISEPMQAATPWPTTFICADAQTYPLEQGSFDLIVSRSTHAPSSAGHRNLWRWSDPRCVGRAPEPMVKALLGAEMVLMRMIIGRLLTSLNSLGDDVRRRRSASGQLAQERPKCP